MKKTFLAIALSTLMVSGCASLSGPIPQPTTAQLIQDAAMFIQIATVAAGVYEALPTANPAIVAQIKLAEIAANTALSAAEAQQAAGTLTPTSLFITALENAAQAYFASVPPTPIPPAKLQP